MSRITQISDNDATEDAAGLFAAIRGKIGMVPNLYRVAANQPAVLQALLGVNESLAGGSFSARTREAIALAVAGFNGCDYCASAHAAISVGLKVDEQQIADHLAGRSSDPKLSAILTLAREIVETRGFVSDDALDEAKSRGLSEAEIVEVTANVVSNIFTNYLNHVASTDIDFPQRTARAA